VCVPRSLTSGVTYARTDWLPLVLCSCAVAQFRREADEKEVDAVGEEEDGEEEEDSEELQEVDEVGEEEDEEEVREEEEEDESDESDEESDDEQQHSSGEDEGEEEQDDAERANAKRRKKSPAPRNDMPMPSAARERVFRSHRK